MRLLWLIGLLVLVGCVKLSQPAPSTRTYRLDYPSPPINAKPLPVTVRVPPFSVGAIYDREPMVYRDNAYTTAVDFYNRWSANPGQMIADLVARDLASSGVYAAVQQAPSLLPSDYLLTGEIEEIEERVNGDSCAARLGLRIVLMRMRGGTGDPIVLRAGYSADEPCVCGDPFALSEAMSKSLARISAQLQQEVSAAIAKDRR